jgi:hypothetical protein
MDTIVDQAVREKALLAGCVPVIERVDCAVPFEALGKRQ